MKNVENALSLYMIFYVKALACRKNLFQYLETIIE